MDEREVIVLEHEVDAAVAPKRRPRKPAVRKPRANAPRRGRSARPLTGGAVASMPSRWPACWSPRSLPVLGGLGHAADWFAVSGPVDQSFPFAAAMLGISLVLAAFLWLWNRGRRAVVGRAPLAASGGRVVLAGAAGWFVTQATFQRELGQVRSLVGGQAQASAGHCAQVFARLPARRLQQVRQVLERAAGVRGDGAGGAAGSGPTGGAHRCRAAESSSIRVTAATVARALPDHRRRRRLPSPRCARTSASSGSIANQRHNAFSRRRRCATTLRNAGDLSSGCWPITSAEQRRPALAS